MDCFWMLWQIKYDKNAKLFWCKNVVLLIYKSHHQDKIVSEKSDLSNGNIYTWKVNF